MMVGDCLELCVAPWQNPIAASGSAYQAYIVAHPTWRYTTLDGHVVADNAPDYDVQQQGNLWYEIFDERPTPVDITWDGANWRVNALVSGEAQDELPNPVCAATQDDIAFGYLSPPSSGGWQATTMAYIPSNPGAAGCLLVVSVTAQEPLLLLHRFGVLLAASDSAAYSFGHVLPMADAYEQALARKLAQQNPSLGIAP